MSGGHFNYNQYRISSIGDDVEQLIRDNKYDSEVIEKFKEGLKVLNEAFVYAQRIDWLVSGDDGEENFLGRLQEDLSKLKE